MASIFALLLKDFDAHVKAMEVHRIVGDFFDIEIDGGGARSFGVGGHLEFFVRGLLELGANQRGGCRNESSSAAQTQL